MERRRFVQTVCVACAAIASGGLPAVLASCAAADVYRGELVGGAIAVPASLLADGKARVIRSDGYPDDIALIRNGSGEFTALVLRCTHADNGLSERGDGFACSLHGSRFDLEGRVTHGPATAPLRKLRTAVSGETVSILTGS